MKHPIQSILEENGDFSVRSYSGRGMYGSSCIGVTGGTIGSVMSAIIAGVTEENQEEVADAVLDLSTDSMGRGIIVYFPGAEYEEDESEEEEDPGRCPECGTPGSGSLPEQCENCGNHE